MFEIKIDGIKEVQDKLNKMAQTAEELEKSKSVPINELMTNEFVKKHTGHDTFESFAIESRLISKVEEVTEETPIIEGHRLFYNFIKPHENLNGLTPSEQAGITIEGDNKWLTLMKTAIWYQKANQK